MDFILRPFEITDATSLAGHANNKKIADNMRDAFPFPYQEENARSFIEMVQANNPKGIRAIVVDGGACGGIGLHAQPDVHRKNMELGYWLSEKYWGQGIITKAIKQMVKYGFETFDIERIYAVPFDTNLASQRVLEKAGFTKEAHLKGTIYKNNKYLDELIYAIRKSEN